MNNLKRLGNKISVTLPKDADRFTGRQCPNKKCLGFFKVEFGTGLTGREIPCNCPYCGHQAAQNQFCTKAQIRYAKSVALRKVSDALVKDLKTLEFNHKPRGGLGIGFSLKLKPGRRPPVHYYREEKLETEIVCELCTLRYAVYGVFAFCPDCASHNSLQVLQGNLELIRKLIDLAKTQETDLLTQLVENALEDCVSAFDGFGRELVRASSLEPKNPKRVDRISFQNLNGVADLLKDQFGIELEGMVSEQEWPTLIRSFNKRHLIAHKMGIVDKEYVANTGDSNQKIGSKIRISDQEVSETLNLLSKLSKSMYSEFHSSPTGQS